MYTVIILGFICLLLGFFERWTAPEMDNDLMWAYLGFACVVIATALEAQVV